VRGQRVDGCGGGGRRLRGRGATPRMECSHGASRARRAVQGWQWTALRRMTRGRRGRAAAAAASAAPSLRCDCSALACAVSAQRRGAAACDDAARDHGSAPGCHTPIGRSAVSPSSCRGAQRTDGRDADAAARSPTQQTDAVTLVEQLTRERACCSVRKRCTAGQDCWLHASLLLRGCLAV